MFNTEARHRINVLAVGADAWPLVPFRTVVYVDRRTVLRSQSLNYKIVDFFLRVRLSDDLFHCHSPLLILHLAPSRTLRSTRDPDHRPARRRRDTFSFPLSLNLEPAEATFPLRVDDMDCLHRQLGEGMRAPDRTCSAGSRENGMLHDGTASLDEGAPAYLHRTLHGAPTTRDHRKPL